jgi:Uma2 family endonuclease
MLTATQLITAEDYARLPDRGVRTELVRGEVIEMNPPYPRHGQICSKIDRIVGAFVDEQELGHVICNDAGIVTEREPDTVRGGNVWYISYQKVPKGPLPNDYLPVPPDIVFEVLSEHDQWPRVYAKIAEYLAVGVAVVCTVDPRDETVRLYFADSPEVVLNADDELTFPNQLPGFSVLVQRLFE